MKLIIDTNERTLSVANNEETRLLKLYSKDAFDILSSLWLKVGWNEKYSYTFSWMGRPIIQLPEDLVRVQEVIYRVKPDVIIETGVAHGGSLIFYASLCKALGKGRVVGVDISIRPPSRFAIETHELGSYITLVEGNSVAPQIVAEVKSLVKPDEAVMILLDSNHTYKHVLAELEAYHRLVSKESYVIATDGIMKDLYDVPRGKSEWHQDNPSQAVQDFVKAHPEFVLEQPVWPFNESELNENVTHWPGAWLRRIKSN